MTFYLACLNWWPIAYADTPEEARAKAEEIAKKHYPEQERSVYAIDVLVSNPDGTFGRF